MKNAKFSLKISLLALSMALLMLKASHWQWGRYKEKIKLVKSYETNKHPLILVNLDNKTLNDNLYRKILLKGRINTKNQFLVANRRDASGPGFWLMAEFQLEESNDSIIISRGFIPFADREKSNWEKFKPSESNQLIGVLQKSITQNSFVSPSQISGQPDYIYMFPDIEKMCSRIERPCLTKEFYLQRLNFQSDMEFPKQSISIEVPPATHFGYTFEWMFLAFITCLFAYLLQAYPGLFNRIFNRVGRSGAFLIVLTCFVISNAYATEKSDQVSNDALIIEHLGQQLDLDLKVQTEEGEKKLSDFLSETKPLILAPVYYECPRLCNLTQTGLVDVINSVKLKLGKDYDVLSISFNDKETVESTKRAAAVYRSKLKNNLEPNSWKFAVTDKDSIQKIMNKIGFSFKEDKGEFIHSAGLVIITSKGVISRYFYGIQFAPDQLRLALVEAAEGRIGDSFDRIMMYCFRYDPTKGIYTLAVWNITRIICSFFAVALFVFLVQLRRREILARKTSEVLAQNAQ